MGGDVDCGAPDALARTAGGRAEAVDEGVFVVECGEVGEKGGVEGLVG